MGGSGWWALLSKLWKRSLSRSRSRSPPEKKLSSFSGSSDSNYSRGRVRSGTKPPDTFRIFFRAVGDMDVKAFVMKIPFKDLELFGEIGKSNMIPHCHSNPPNSNRFRRLQSHLQCLSTISANRGFPYGNSAAVGSMVYALTYEEEPKMRRKVLTLELDCETEDLQRWKKILSAPYKIQKGGKFEPNIVSLGGRIFFLGGEPYGLIYNPDTQSWSRLPHPVGVRLDHGTTVFTASLGEANGKIFFYERRTDQYLMESWVHIFDVRSNAYSSYPSTEELDNATLSSGKLLETGWLTNKREVLCIG